MCVERKPIHKLIRIFHERGNLRGIVIVIRHRIGDREILKEIEGSSVIYVKRNGFYFKSTGEGKLKEELTFIPSHRIVEVKKEDVGS